MIGSIRVEGVGKRFTLFHERPRSLKEAVTLRRRRIYDEFWALQDVTFRSSRARPSGSSAPTAPESRPCSSASHGS